MSRRGSLQHLDNGHESVSSSPERQASFMRPSLLLAGEQQQSNRGIPLPGMVMPRSLHASPMHGFVNPLGPSVFMQGSPPMQPRDVASVGVMAGMPMHPHSPRQQGEILCVWREVNCC